MLGIAFLAAMAAGQAALGAAPAPSLQARFDAASKAAAENHCREAIADFEALEPLAAVRKSATVGGTVKLRKGVCLVSVGRFDEAEAALRAGIAALQANPEFRLDVADGQMALGEIAYARYDYAGAKGYFEAARKLADATQSFNALVWLTRTTMFDPGDAAIGYADQALAQAATLPDLSKQGIGNLRTLHARALFNHGQAPAAYRELKQALRDQGGLGMKVNASDVVTRSDLAIAALLNKDNDGARQYLAYTGAGRFEKAPFASAVSMDPPPCGGPADIKPDDVAVVEFSIRDDGSVGQATPIYASRNGPMALEFARAVSDWSWRPEDVQEVPLLFRLLTRVELRCSTAGQRPSPLDVLREDTEAWLMAQGVQPFTGADLGEAAQVAPARAELARRRAAGGGLALTPVLFALAANPVVPEDERTSLAQEAYAIIARAGAPAAPKTYAAIVSGDEETVKSDKGEASRRDYRDFLRGLLAKPDVAADAHADATLRILITQDGYRTKAPDDAVPLLQHVVDDRRLAATDRLRIMALLRLATLEARAGNLDAAQSSYAQTGLNDQQCALLDLQPALRKSGGSANDFPAEAARWGFEGWVQSEFDVAADGRTLNQRAIIAYPPFVFRDAAVGILKDTRYQQSYRPQGGAGCGGARQSVAFRMPRTG